ncbi:MAG: hypothetical protein OEV90_09940 [Gammaproteobacteria bacterium]|nr:hypothetical protein [Gammaproteobacteria bacterium]MDH4312496.1 hypothetical protein [Gammaproteobacteria bacterium]
MAVTKRKQAPKTPRRSADEDPPLTPAQRRALDRHVKDMEDRTRYLLVSATLPGISLYYLVNEDSWAFDDPTTATLFKRRASAKAVQSLLRPGVFVVPCEVDDRGRLVLSSIADRKVGKVRLAVQPSWKKKRAVRR